MDAAQFNLREACFGKHYAADEIDPLLAELAQLRQFRDDVTLIRQDEWLGPTKYLPTAQSTMNWAEDRAAAIRQRNEGGAQ